MDSRIFKVLKNICMFLFVSDMFVHAVIGASLINGFIKGTASMSVMLVLIITISKAGNKKQRKQKEQNAA